MGKRLGSVALALVVVVSFVAFLALHAVVTVRGYSRICGATSLEAQPELSEAGGLVQLLASMALSSMQGGSP